MPSISLTQWNATRANELAQITNALKSVAGIQRGRRFATQQLNFSYTVLLSSQFQGFCRDLHSECVDHIVRAVTPAVLQTVLRHEFTIHRQLDRKNPTPSSIGSDFNRLGFQFIPILRAANGWNSGRLDHLEDMNRWRNAIAHYDFDQTKLGGTILRLARIQQWHRACNQLAAQFDATMRNHINQLIGNFPW